MDPEPGRCRRTDGKKWRCSWNVVPDQKYCERHMHRGRQRSRKHVEASEPDASSTIKSSNTNTTITSSNTDNTNANLSISVPVNLQLTTPFFNTSNNAAITATDISSLNESNCNVDVNEGLTATPTIITTPTSNTESKNNVSVNKDTTTTIIRAANGNNNYSKNNNNYVDVKDAFCNHINDNNNVHRSSNYGSNGNSGSTNYGSNGNFGSTMPGFRFSPRSVLQVIGCSNPCSDYRSVIEADLHRCRRTDGKKWRCSRDVVPDQKYCGKHMHRGAKKLVVASKQVTLAAAAPSTSSTHPAPLAIPIKADDCINLNTNLSISIPASPQPMTNDEKSSTSSSSSDATTISDEISSISHQLALSP
uniref:Growth-regulating factor n=1 Tax=Davidia involucrata TaxID=16924 RepID=A0A5B7B715_DAVIN